MVRERSQVDHLSRNVEHILRFYTKISNCYTYKEELIKNVTRKVAIALPMFFKNLASRYQHEQLIEAETQASCFFRIFFALILPNTLDTPRVIT